MNCISCECATRAESVSGLMKLNLIKFIYSHSLTHSITETHTKTLHYCERRRRQSKTQMNNEFDCWKVRMESMEREGDSVSSLIKRN